MYVIKQSYVKVISDRIYKRDGNSVYYDFHENILVFDKELIYIFSEQNFLR